MNSQKLILSSTAWSEIHRFAAPNPYATPIIGFFSDHHESMAPMIGDFIRPILEKKAGALIKAKKAHVFNNRLAENPGSEEIKRLHAQANIEAAVFHKEIFDIPTNPAASLAQAMEATTSTLIRSQRELAQYMAMPEDQRANVQQPPKIGAISFIVYGVIHSTAHKWVDAATTLRAIFKADVVMALIFDGDAGETRLTRSPKEVRRSKLQYFIDLRKVDGRDHFDAIARSREYAPVYRASSVHKGIREPGRCIRSLYDRLQFVRHECLSDVIKTSDAEDIDLYDALIGIPSFCVGHDLHVKDAASPYYEEIRARHQWHESYTGENFSDV